MRENNKLHSLLKESGINSKIVPIDFFTSLETEEIIFNIQTKNKLLIPRYNFCMLDAVRTSHRPISKIFDAESLIS